MPNEPNRGGRADNLGAVAEVALGLVVLAVSWYLTDLRYRVNQEFPLATLSDLLAGTAHKPFQLRALVPWIVSGLHALTDAPVKSLYLGVDTAATVGIYYAFRYYLISWFAGASAALLAGSVFLVLPWNYLLAREVPIVLPYDMAAIALFTLGLALLQRRSWKWFYPLFVIATFNREGTIFLTAIMIITMWREMPRNGLIAHIGTQVGIWLIVKFLLQSVYATNPGDSLEFYHVNTQAPHWRSNVEILTAIPHLLTVLSCFGFVWIAIPLFRRNLTDAFLRRALWVVPMFLLVTFFVGNMNEMRVYGELLPIVLAPVLLIIVKMSEASKPAHQLS